MNALNSLLMILAILTLPALAEEEIQEEPAREEVSTTENADEKAEPDKLRSRELGAAFKNFRPSEEISADNAVAFPVDI